MDYERTVLLLLLVKIISSIHLFFKIHTICLHSFVCIFLKKATTLFFFSFWWWLKQFFFSITILRIMIEKGMLNV
jgi:hypothetical protein